MIAIGKPRAYGIDGIEAAKKSANSETKIDKSVKITQIKPKDTKKKEYICTSCGESWTNPKGHFNKSKSPLFIANDGYVNICYSCRDSYYYSLVELYCGNEEKAINRICQLFDWLYHEKPLSMSKQISQDRSRIGDYANKLNLGQVTKEGTTYLDTIKIRAEEEKSKSVESIDDIDDYTEYKLTPKMVKFWGVNYEPQIYQTLQGYYDELLKLCETKPDIKKQKMMKNLCLLEYQMQSNIQSGKDIGTLSNSYKTMFEASGLKNEEVDINKDSYGTWLAMIEKYTPADYYKDKTKYKDFFGIGEYIERFMFRPLKNLLTGSKEKEKEFWINDDKGGE